jgi:hypothetical protein
MSELSLKSKVLTELSTSWNTSVIAKPNFFDWDLPQSTKSGNSIVVGEMSASLKPASINNIAFIRLWPFVIKCFATDRTTCNKLVSEARRIVNAFYISGGWWKVSSIIPEQGNPMTVINLMCEERLFTVNTGWG